MKAGMVGKDLVNMFEDDLKKEMHKEMIRLGKNVLKEEELGNDEKNAFEDYKGDSPTIKYDDEVKCIEETCGQIKEGEEKILDETKQLFDDLEDVANEGKEVVNHVKLLAWKIAKFVHVLVSVLA